MSFSIRYLCRSRRASSRSTPSRTVTEIFPCHEVGDLGIAIGRKTHIAIGDDADEGAAFVDHRNAGNAVALFQGEDIGEASHQD